MMRLSAEATERRRCLGCGSHVPAGFRRVHGDEQGRIHRCPDCDTRQRIWKGSAAGKDVDTPDPKESPGRHGPYCAGWRE